MAEDDSLDAGRGAQLTSWVAIGAGLFIILYGLGLLYFGLNMLIRALDGGYTPLPAVGMLISWLVTLMVGVFALHYGWRMRRQLVKERSTTKD